MFLISASANFSFLIILLFSVFIPFFSHLILVRLFCLFKKPFFRQKGAIVSCLFGFCILTMIFFFWAISLYEKAWLQILWSGIYLFLVYILFAYVYFHIFNMSETARRIQILVENYKTGILEKEELVKKYTCQDMVSARLERLVSLGILRLTKNRYFLENKALLLLIFTKAVFSFRRILIPFEK